MGGASSSREQDGVGGEEAVGNSMAPCQQGVIPQCCRSLRSQQRISPPDREGGLQNPDF